MVQSHTVLRSLAHKYADEPVLVLGGINDAVRKVAEERVSPFPHVTQSLNPHQVRLQEEL